MSIGRSLTTFTFYWILLVGLLKGKDQSSYQTLAPSRDSWCDPTHVLWGVFIGQMSRIHTVTRRCSLIWFMHITILIIEFIISNMVLNSTAETRTINSRSVLPFLLPLIHCGRPYQCEPAVAVASSSTFHLHHQFMYTIIIIIIILTTTPIENYVPNRFDARRRRKGRLWWHVLWPVINSPFIISMWCGISLLSCCAAKIRLTKLPLNTPQSTSCT